MRDFAIELTDRPGELGRVATALSRYGVNLKAVTGLAVDELGQDGGEEHDALRVGHPDPELRPDRTGRTALALCRPAWFPAVRVRDGGGAACPVEGEELVEGLESAREPGDVRDELVAFFDQAVESTVGGGSAR